MVKIGEILLTLWISLVMCSRTKPKILFSGLTQTLRLALLNWKLQLESYIYTGQFDQLYAVQEHILSFPILQNGNIHWQW